MSQDYISLEEIMRIIHTVTSIPDDLNYYEPDVENGLIEIGEATVIFCYLKYFLDYFDNVLENIADEMESLKNESLEFIAKSDELLSVEMQMGLLWDYTLILIEERFHFDVKEIVNIVISKNEKLLVQLVSESDLESEEATEEEVGGNTTYEENYPTDDSIITDPLDFSNLYKYRQTDKLN